MSAPLAFAGGTGPQGLGLGIRFAAAGEAVLIGSRVVERARAVAETIRARVPGARADGCENLEALNRTDRVFLTLPFAALTHFLPTARERLAGKLVVDVVVPLAVERGFADVANVPGARSAGELIHQELPDAHVVSAFKNVPAERLCDLEAPLDDDVPLCGENQAARETVAGLVRCIHGLRPVDAGTIRNARFVEAITALLINLNRRHRTRAGIRFTALG